LIAGGAITGVIVAILSVVLEDGMAKVNIEHFLTNTISQGGYQLMGTLFFIGLMTLLYRQAVKK
jgi:hypothetical protein